ncbi:unnamed protein product [Urochloa decumbens]|uniref:DUF3615 domain-containing protein n=1 Tax=Urochloa decumbens TaxID=240449 RepID=A0ABC9DDP9_9POAL
MAAADAGREDLFADRAQANSRARRARQTPPPVEKEDLLPPHTTCKVRAAESASAQTLQESNVSSLDEFLDNSSEEKLLEGVVSSLELVTTSSEESVTSNPQTVSHIATNGSSRTFPSRFGKLGTGTAESTSAITLQEPNVSSSDEFCDSLSEERITTGPQMVLHNTSDGSQPSASSLGSDILIRQPPNSFNEFYVRIDRRGTFWTYPNLGGPFQSMDETEKAIHSFCAREARTATTKGNTYGEKWYLVQAILDQFNDENNLSGDLAYELENLLRKQWILENLRWYYHFNFTTKQKADGGHCFGCKNNGSRDMQHPNETDAYIGGHVDGYLPFGCNDLSSSDDNEGDDDGDVVDDDNDDDVVDDDEDSVEYD